MNLLVILLAGAAVGALAGLVLRSGRLALSMALGTAGAFLAGAMDGEALLTGVSPVTMAASVLGAVALVAGAHAMTRRPDVTRETTRKWDSLS
jgi:uncharacterized membrane protein YeaQ/YmgE (transglycosylase-associated protein family)